VNVRSFFAALWRGLDGLRRALHLIVLLVIFGIALGVLLSGAARIPSKAALLIEPEGELVEQLSGDPFARAVQAARGERRRETLLWDLTDSIRAAATDRRIQALALDLDKFDGGTQPTLEELARAIRDFRASGKKVVAYGTELSQEGYYLAAQADESYLDPMGFVLIDGYERYRMYLKEALDKLGVDINVFRVGQFKSAVETYTRTNMSPEDREESRAYLAVLWTSYQEAITRARKIAPDGVAKYVGSLAEKVPAAGGNAAHVALDAGLITGIKTNLEVEKRLGGIVGEDKATGSFRAVSVSDYLTYAHDQKKLRASGKPRVGVIVAVGEILDGDQPPGTIGGDSTAKLIRQARLDSDIKALVLRVDSPGGSVLASEEIYRELKALRATGKPVVVSMSGYAASGGYYISAPADEIWASPATVTGSIGIFAIIPTVDRTLGKVGVSVDGVGTTPLSGQLHRPAARRRGARAAAIADQPRVRRVPRACSERAEEEPRRYRRHCPGARVGRHGCTALRSGRSARLVRRGAQGGRPPRQADRLRPRVHRARAHLDATAGARAQDAPGARVLQGERRAARAGAPRRALRSDRPRAGALEPLQRPEPRLRLLLL